MDIINDTSNLISEVIEREFKTGPVIAEQQKVNFFSRLFKSSTEIDPDIVKLMKTEIDAWKEKEYITPQIAEKLKSIPPTMKLVEIFDKAQEIIKKNRGL